MGYDNYADVKADKMHLPVDLVKLLERKDLLLENMDMAAMINTGDGTGFDAARVIADFKKKFEAKGVKIFYVQKLYKGDAKFPWKNEREWHHWFEYVDMDVVRKDYTPKDEYPQVYLDMYNQCKNGDTKPLALNI